MQAIARCGARCYILWYMAQIISRRKNPMVQCTKAEDIGQFAFDSSHLLTFRQCLPLNISCVCDYISKKVENFYSQCPTLIATCYFFRALKQSFILTYPLLYCECLIFLIFIISIIYLFFFLPQSIHES